MAELVVAGRGERAPGEALVGAGAGAAAGASRWLRTPGSAVAVVGLALGAAAGGALAGCHPTGVAAVDAVETAVLAGSVALACSRAGRGSLLGFAAVCALLGRGWPQVLAAVAVVAGFVSVLVARGPHPGGAVGAAGGAQAGAGGDGPAGTGGNGSSGAVGDGPAGAGAPQAGAGGDGSSGAGAAQAGADGDGSSGTGGEGPAGTGGDGRVDLRTGLLRSAVPGLLTGAPAGALVGALGVQAMLRWSPIGFHGAPSAIAAVVVLVPAVSAYRHLSPAGRRRARRIASGVVAAGVVLSVPLLVAAALSASRVRSGADAARQAFDAVGQGTAASAVQPLQVAAADFAGAAHDLGAWWTEPSRLVPVVSEQRTALAGATAAAARLGTVAASVAPSFDTSRLAYHGGAIDLAAVTAMGPPARVLDGALTVAADRVAAVRSPWLAGPVAAELGRFARQVGRARTSTSLAVAATARLPAMLGASGPRHYVVLFMSLAESRGLGGIVGAYAELTAQDGRVTLTRSGSEGDLNAALPAAGATLTGPANFLSRYGQFDPGRFFQDVTLSPDLPTVGAVVSQMFPQAGGDHVNGVLVVDPYGLARLLAITGPVAVPGLAQPLTSTTAVPFLLRGLFALDGGSDVAQNAVLKDLLHAAFSRLVDGSLPAPAALSQALEPAVLGGHIGLWSADPRDAGLVAGLHLADAFPAPGSSDLVSVTTQNAGANKLDAYIHQSITDQVTVDPTTGAVRARLTVTLRNAVPASGLPSTVIDSPLAPGTPPGADPLLVSVYSPYGLAGVTIGGVPGTMGTGQELGTPVYRQWVTVPARSTTTIVLTLVGATVPGLPYELRLRLPPAANPVAFRATLDVGGHTQTWVAGPQADQVHGFAWP